MARTDFEQDVLERLSAIQTEVKDLKKSIDGNGRPGIADRLTKAETLLEERTGASSKQVAGVSAGVSSLLFALMELFKTYVA